MCKELKQQDGLVQSRSFYFVKKACQVSATNLSKCLMEIDSFYFVPVQPLNFILNCPFTDRSCRTRTEIYFLLF